MSSAAKPPARLGIAVALVVTVLIAVAARLCQLALVDGSRLAELARRQHSGTEELRPLRGAILDRSGEPLAMSVPAGSVFLRPRQLTPGAASDAVARVLGLPRRSWAQKTSSAAPFVWVKRQTSPDELAVLRDLNVPGVGILSDRRRLYPYGRLAAPVIGFAGVDSQGLEGIEFAYDSYLRGPAGEFDVERDGAGRKILVRGVDKAMPRQGADVTLTIDSALQFVAERELDARVTETHAKGGLVMMLNPHSGEILALAQNPSFDPNQLGGANPGEWRNRAVADSYEPGSTLKSLLVATALEEGVVTPNDRFFCENGDYRVGGKTIHDHHPHGWLSLAEVLQVSSNICAAKIGERLGAKRYGQKLRAFGLGAPLGVDLPGEQAGIVRPSAQWKTIDLATMSFGQGIAVTSVQLAAAYAALANGGILMRPYIVRRVTDESGEVLLENQPTVLRRVVSEQTAKQVTEMLEGVVTKKGTAEAAALPGVRLAGKTGTAQKVDHARGGYSRGRIASFVGYFPAEDPEVVMLVVIDEPRTTIWGGTAAAPVFRAVAAAAIERLGIHAAAVSSAAVTMEHATTAAAEASSPSGANYLGLSLREAIERAHRSDIAIEVKGSGYVVRQDPPLGHELPPGGTLRLELAAAEGPVH